jgi:ElaA protein
MRTARFAELTGAEVYGLCRLRVDVFVVEQDCPYGDLDGRDDEPGTRHVLLREHDRVVGYARVLDDETTWRIGRVALAPAARGRGLADVVMETALQVCPDRDVLIDAQTPLAGWYESLGFAVAGAEFLDDGIPHLPMRRPAGG